MKTIAQLVGRSLKVDGFSSSVTMHAERVGEKTLLDLTAADIAFCLRQDLAREHVLPLALEILCEQPFIEAYFYPGDLLAATLELPSSFWQDHPALYNEFVDLSLSVQVTLETIDEVIRPLLNRFHNASQS